MVDNIVHLAIAPPHALEAELVQTVAAVIHKDPYGTRLLLSGKIPRLAAHYQTLQEAELAAQVLRALGLLVIICRDSELRRSARDNFRASNVIFGERDVRFRNINGKERIIGSENLFLILKGKWQTQAEEETIKTQTKLNLPLTLLAGGIPILRKTKPKPQSQMAQVECFLRIYDKIAPEPVVDIIQHELDYSFLGDKKDAYSLTNLNSLVTMLREKYPQAIFDDKLTASLGIDMPFANPAEDITIKCNLLYLYYRNLTAQRN
jgi:hypothetical protein